MTARTYIELFEPQLVLSLIPVPGGYTVRDQHGGEYVLSPSPFGFCARQMRALQTKRDALIDGASVLRWYRHERWIAHKTANSERGPKGLTSIAPAGSVPVSASGAAPEMPPLSDDFSRAVPSNVFPLWRDA